MAEKQPQEEPMLAIDQIQGNVIPGFNKDFQALLFLKIEEGKENNFRRWLGNFVGGRYVKIATMQNVLAFRSILTEEKRHGRSREQKITQKITWRNIAFSHNALRNLGMFEKGDFKDQAFQDGLWKRAKDLGGPTSPEDEGNPRNWVVGGPDNEADVILIVASDDRLDLLKEVASIENSIYAPKITRGNKPDQSGLRIIFKQEGACLPGKREHFGFRDGISQPGIRGKIPDSAGGGYTTRGYKLTDKTGRDLLWPGEFVFGTEYPKQDPGNAKKLGRPALDENPVWAQDGSFLVFLRFRQDVGAFRRFIHDTARELDMDPNLLEAKCVGRWPSGTPILDAPEHDNAKAVITENEPINNNFNFKGEDDRVCPFAAHIRKVYARDEKSETQTHRLLRRGIPYVSGEFASSSLSAPDDDEGDRGLLFLAYQTSIENQFEFLMKKQTNNPDFKEKGTGFDPIIGQNNDGPRTFTYTSKDGCKQSVPLPPDCWVITTGGGYFFTPSVKTLQQLAGLMPKD